MSAWGGVVNILDVYRLSPGYGDPLKMPADLMGLFEKLSITHCGKEGSAWQRSGLSCGQIS